MSDRAGASDSRNQEPQIVDQADSDVVGPRGSGTQKQGCQYMGGDHRPSVVASKAGVRHSVMSVTAGGARCRRLEYEVEQHLPCTQKCQGSGQTDAAS